MPPVTSRALSSGVHASLNSTESTLRIMPEIIHAGINQDMDKHLPRACRQVPSSFLGSTGRSLF
jgi:hypothetical protein